jgi:hypothetical protein
MSESILIFLIGQAIAVLTVVISFYVRTTTKLRELELRINLAEKQDHQVLEKLIEISTQITDLRIEMQNKQDRD